MAPGVDEFDVLLEVVLSLVRVKGHIKWLSLISISLCQNMVWHDTSSCTCSLYLYCICKVAEIRKLQ